MANQHVHIAIDLGAESGRVMLGRIENQRLSIHEAHRFRHLPVPTPAGLCWDFTGLWQQILLGLRQAGDWAREQNLSIASVGVDTWGVDWSLVSSEDVLLGLPHCYREPAFPAAYERVLQKQTAQQIYDATGIQLMPINSLYQLEHRYRQSPELFDADCKLLFMPDLLHWLLTGNAVAERTIASTSQMLNARTGKWNTDLLRKLGLPVEMLPELIDPGQTVGYLRDEVAQQVGLDASVPVIAPPSHDTASAVAAVPAQGGDDWCYLSSGTWSLLGVELDSPCINDAAYQANFTNELGAGSTVRFLKNLSGLWLVQEVRRQLQRQGNTLDYVELTAMAEAAPAFATLIPTSDPVFASPGNMIDKIQAYARQTDQPVPQTPGELVRCCLESLSLTYRQAVQTLEGLLDRKLAVLHILGGGGRNQLLNQMTADATGLRVIAGPDEATAMGNILTQAIGLGHVQDLATARQIVANSVELTTKSPSKQCDLNQQAARYQSLPAAD